MTAQRLPTSGRIDRARPIPFTWNGKSLRGFAGDTLASALLANDVFLLGRSFKYHRPRGIMSAGVEESGALVTVGSGARADPNVKATAQELYPGLAARGQNAWPSLRLDVGAINSLFARFLSAGFYYKTFMGPRGGGTAFWMQCEKLIRRAAGLGVAAREPDPDEYEHAHSFCDVLVVGAGPAGLAAAADAAETGLDVWLVEQQTELGGELLNQPATTADKKLTELVGRVRAQGVRVMTRATVFGLYDGGVAGVLERAGETANAREFQPRQRFWKIRARQIILATGALERSIAFGDNDRPGVMTAAAGRAYLNRYGILPGEKIAVATNNDSAYAAATELADAGAEVVLLDARAAVHAELTARAKRHNVTTRLAHAPLRALGRMRVRGLATAEETGGRWVRRDTIPCDCLLVAGGWSPTIHLHSHRGGKVKWNAELNCFLAAPSDDTVCIVGAAAGIWRAEACENSGRAAGSTARAALEKFSVKKTYMPKITLGGDQTPMRPLYEVQVAGEQLKSFVDPQNDVTADDIRLAAREGFTAAEHLKRYTTLGMATDGGKVGNVMGMAILAAARGVNMDAVGITTFRPPYTPVALGALAGRAVQTHFRPLHRTPLHQWNLNHGAVMTPVGLWQRPWYFPRADESIAESYVREATTVRKAVGLCDVTSLGKIAVQGPDATEFLNRIYTNPFAKLPVGRARYGIMLRDDGIVMDDGTVWRLGECEYFMTTTTAHAGKVFSWLEELLQTRWHNLRVQVTNVTDAWAGCAVAGPQSRETLHACLSADARAEDVVGNEKLPFMGVVETTLNGDIPCRIARISFSGERAYEIYTPADYATAAMELLWDAAQSRDGCLYGLEALGALRIEKGHVTGAELDGRVTMDDAGLGKMASTKKSYIGSVLRARSELLRADRPQLVGIRAKTSGETFNAGSILRSAKQTSGHGVGWITAVTHSPALGYWIGIGFINGGYAEWQTRRVIAADPVRAGNTEVRITSPHMYDPTGERMHG